MSYRRPVGPLASGPILGDSAQRAASKFCGPLNNQTHYEPGEQSGAWIKLRTNMEQEFVIGGYIPGVSGFDALLVGVYENKELIFVAEVKNGFVPRIRDELFPGS